MKTLASPENKMDKKKDDLRPIPTRFDKELQDSFRYILYRRPNLTIAGIIRDLCNKYLPDIINQLKEEELYNRRMYIAELNEHDPKDVYKKSHPRA